MAVAQAALPRVDEVVERVRQTVAGLDEQARRIAVTVRRHVLQGMAGHRGRIPNLLVVAPTGAGKTYLLEAIRDCFPEVPWIFTASTEFSDASYVGRPLPSMFSDFWQRQTTKEERRAAADRAQQFGVVVFDEWDKLRVHDAAQERRSSSLQAELLKITEGGEFLAKRNDQDAGQTVRTHGMLFIGVGAFQGLNEVVAGRHGEHEVLESSYLRAFPADFVRYGFLEELVGRFANVVTLPFPTPESLLRILVEQVVPGYERQLELEGKRLHVDPPVLHRIATEAYGAHIGARALAVILEEVLWSAWAGSAEGDTLVVDAQALMTRHAKVV